ncbi:MAG: apolipoprotein N-acyltransferase, partial [Desulfobacterales bacterium]|nr:apolipoprotein N-acyltransferase [Desulfobacterales bacterium]
MGNRIRNHRYELLLAVLSGVLLCLAFPKIDQGWLAWFALVPFLVALREADGRTGFAIGFAAGMAHYLGLIYWTAYTMNVYGHVPLMQALCALALLAAILATFMAVFTMGLCLVCRAPWQLAIGGPALWVLMEWLHTWLFTGFPWELLGYSQHAYLAMIQVADLFGVPGLSALIFFCNALLCLAFLHWRRMPWRGRPVGRGLLVRSAAVLGVALLLVVGYGGYRLRAMDTEMAAAPRTRVAVVQGNIDQEHKWDLAFQRQTTEKYVDLSMQAARQAVDLIIWPETATPFYMYHDAELTDIVLEGVRSAGTHFIIGSPSAEQVNNEFVYFNRAYLMNPQAEVMGKYDKVHLVPFGEYVPLKRWLPFLGKMVAQVGDFKAGPQGNTLVWQGHPIGMLVCYEAIFPDLARAMVGNGAELLVNITNDAWFGRTSAAYQHFSMAVFRAVENRRFLARSANTGISGYIDPCGRVLSTTPLYEDAAPVAEVGLMRGRTLYSRWGDLPLVIVSALLVILCAVSRMAASNAEDGNTTPLANHPA